MYELVVIFSEAYLLAFIPIVLIVNRKETNNAPAH